MLVLLPRFFNQMQLQNFRYSYFKSFVNGLFILRNVPLKQFLRCLKTHKKLFYFLFRKKRHVVVLNMELKTFCFNGTKWKGTESMVVIVVNQFDVLRGHGWNVEQRLEKSRLIDLKYNFLLVTLSTPHYLELLSHFLSICCFYSWNDSFDRFWHDVKEKFQQGWNFEGKIYLFYSSYR